MPFSCWHFFFGQGFATYFQLALSHSRTDLPSDEHSALSSFAHGLPSERGPGSQSPILQPPPQMRLVTSFFALSSQASRCLPSILQTANASPRCVLQGSPTLP